MSFEQVVRIPVDRVGAVIGKEGSTKRYLEGEMGVALQVDGKEGVVTLRSESALGTDPFSATRVIEAIGRGFSPQKACRLLDEGTALDVIDLRGYAGKSANSLERIRGRVIGLKGKSRRVIEELTSCNLSVYGRTVAIIGEASQVQLASDAVRSLASGSKHRTVYNTLQKSRTKKKMERMFLWEGTSPETLEEKIQKLER
ncbi:MAG: RNA-binding protein [Nitrososphaerota archaeon]|nr:RNA-binding protein [Nitrososphaerota archaeon]MDG6941553.1 RNA-binding protein [Nitrososphaerota archaeon]MDG6951094.1 RNA-binding protein [Nitrososphaerota archaeon]